ncbi:ribosome-associated translation inhibitor RaiA [bacterium]|nr:ribosome-associated translation inhibitor RaiA [bacterium]
MQITVSGKNIEVSKALREQVEKKLSKITARYDTLTSAKVTLSVDNRRQIVQMTLFGKGAEYRAESDSEDMYGSISEAVDKLNKQLAKINEKPMAVRKKDVVSKSGERITVPVEIPAEEAPKADNSGIKTVSFIAEALTVAEAVKVLEEKGHTFYTFFNTETERINVVYTTEKGVALIDPKIP